MDVLDRVGCTEVDGKTEWIPCELVGEVDWIVDRMRLLQDRVDLVGDIRVG